MPVFERCDTSFKMRETVSLVRVGCHEILPGSSITYPTWAKETWAWSTNGAVIDGYGT